MFKKTYWPLLPILLLAFGLRIWNLTTLPPGLTHDEANHAREALGILQGVLLFYFPLNYGSEPLYSYLVAGSMALLGQHLLVLRLVTVFFSVLTIAAMYRWVVRLFDPRTAWVTAVLLSIIFWPLASSREALRAGILPFFIVTAVWFFWQMVWLAPPRRRAYLWPTLGFGLSIAITLHIYLAARLVWVLFPLFVLYLLLLHRDLGRRLWLPTLGGLLLAGLLVVPMFTYIQRHPYVLTRLDMLDGPLAALRGGDLRPILHNVQEALLAFIWPGWGDSFLAYNIPGRPVFDVLTAVFFVAGLAVTVWRWKRPSYAFVLLWFAVGIAPSLITGATANTTRNLAALPVVCLLPALGFEAIVRHLPTHRYTRTATAVLLTGWLVVAGLVAANDYFLRWGQMPEVRGAYQINMVQMLDYVQTRVSGDTAVIISTIYPGPAHDPSLALLLAPDTNNPKRWADARAAFIVPAETNAIALIPASTPPHAAFQPLLQSVATIPLRPDDLDPAFTEFQVNRAGLNAYPANLEPVNFGNALTLQAAHWLNAAQPGQSVELLTIWRIEDPALAGPLTPPVFTTDAVLFTQILGPDGAPFAQQDALNAPSWAWQSGDTLLQLHTIALPEDTAVGQYPAIVGLYDRQTGQRLSVLGADGTTLGDYATVAPLEVRKP